MHALQAGRRSADPRGVPPFIERQTYPRGRRLLMVPVALIFLVGMALFAAYLAGTRVYDENDENIKARRFTPIVVDLRNVYAPKEMAAAGFQYSCIGRPITAGRAGND